MKNNILITFILLFASTCISAQALDKINLKCLYQVTYITDTLNLNKITEDLMVLDIGKKVSKYYSYNTFRADSMIKADATKGVSAAQMLLNKNKYGKYGAMYELYKNYPEHKITICEKLVLDYYRFEEPYEFPKWTILADTATIAKYHCQKATCSFRGRQYEAWYTTEIPVSNGPWKFAGLPGLIVKVSDIQLHYQFELVDLKNMTIANSIEFGQNSYINVSKENFTKLKAKSQSDFIGFINSTTNVSIQETGEPRQMRPKKRYNPIER